MPRQKSGDLAGGWRVISVQVLNEFASVASRKFKMPWPDVCEALDTMRAGCEVVPLTVEIHETGLAIAERYGLSFYDSLIWPPQHRRNAVLLIRKTCKTVKLCKASPFATLLRREERKRIGKGTVSCPSGEIGDRHLSVIRPQRIALTLRRALASCPTRNFNLKKTYAR